MILLTSSQDPAAKEAVHTLLGGGLDGLCAANPDAEDIVGDDEGSYAKGPDHVLEDVSPVVQYGM